MLNPKEQNEKNKTLARNKTQAAMNANITTTKKKKLKQN